MLTRLFTYQTWSTGRRTKRTNAGTRRA